MEKSEIVSSASKDTAADGENLRIERLRHMPAWRKLELMAEMSESVRALALAGLRQRHPEDSAAQRRRLADLVLGQDLAACAYGAPPEDDGC